MRTTGATARAQLRRAAAIIRRGGIVGFPTETVYGLGANALSADAVRGIFRAKGRPADNPLIVHVADERMLDDVAAAVPPTARLLLRRFWPGPLTILFERSPHIPEIVTAGLPTVAVRIPDHPVALALIREAGVPIAAPSANRSGRPSPTSAAHVREDFPKVMVLDGGPTRHGVESTVIDVRGARPMVLRLGAITLEQLRGVLPRITVAAGVAGAPSSPGQKYLHYSPSRPLFVFRRKETLLRYAKGLRRPVILCASGQKRHFKGYTTVDLGANADEIAHNLFAALRTKMRGDCLLVLAVQKKGKGRAVMDRLERAATKVL
jgi:L-threonylcarbamoyladenylate synthase